MENSFIIREAKDFTKEEIIRFKNILINAGEVVEYTFDNLIKRNPILLFYPNTENIEAIGALKRPNKSYKIKVFRKSQSKFDPDTFDYELGWVVSLKRGKGIGKNITTHLANYKPRIYATTREKNEMMKHILKINEFQIDGIAYNSERGSYKNILYIKEK